MNCLVIMTHLQLHMPPFFSQGTFHLRLKMTSTDSSNSLSSLQRIPPLRYVAGSAGIIIIVNVIIVIVMIIINIIIVTIIIIIIINIKDTPKIGTYLLFTL